MLGQTGHKGHRKFQTLALMNAHNPHNIRIFIQGIRLAIIHLIFFQLLHVTHKVKQSKIACLLKVGSLGQKHFHIGFALAAAGKCRDIIQVIEIIQNALQQIPDWHIRSVIPIFSKHL